MDLILTWGTYPAIMALCMLQTWYLRSLGAPSLSIVLINSTFYGIIIFLLEKTHPASKNWNFDWENAKADIWHVFISNPLPGILFEALFVGGLYKLSLKIAATFGRETLWPHSWPFFLQMVLAFILAEFAFYSLHRFFHEVDNAFFWKWHAVHHSIEKMYVLASTRIHPVQTFLTFGAQLFILSLFGAPEEVLLYKTCFVATHGLLQHANIKMKFGWLNYIFSTAELHRWHHSQNIEESNSNYGNNIVFWDLLLGTHFYPKGRSSVIPLGLPPGVKYTNTFLGHLMMPFEWNKIQPSIDVIKGQTNAKWQKV